MHGRTQRRGACCACRKAPLSCSEHEKDEADEMTDQSEQTAPRTYRMGELFAGPGGIAVGAHLALKDPDLFGRVKLKHAWANDYDADTVKTYFGAVRRHDPTLQRSNVIHADVRELDIDGLGDIDGFAFGFPCNDYSLVGERKGIQGEFGPLYSYGVKVLQAKQPEWFVAENVGGIRSHAETFSRILFELEAAGAGYELTTHLYRFEEYEVPQKRHRVIIVGIRKDLGKRFAVPAPTTPHRKDQVSARDAIEKRPIATMAFNHELPRHSSSVVRRLTQIKPGQNAWNADLSDDSRINVKGATLSQIYKRLKPDEPSYTVTGSGGGGTSGYHWSEPRALTNRERARLQTFDDEHRFVGGALSVRKQVGMAVPPRGAQVIFEALFKTLTGVNYASVPASLSAAKRR
jgi:DNA (cytosine-5)-methyltransferase 1